MCRHAFRGAPFCDAYCTTRVEVAAGHPSLPAPVAPGGSPEREVAIPVGRAAGIEGRSAVGTGVVGSPVLGSGHRRAAGAAEHGCLVSSVAGPAHDLVVGGRPVALEARVVHLAARKPDGAHVPRPVVVCAAGLWIHAKAPQGHRESVVGGRGLCGLSGGGTHGNGKEGDERANRQGMASERVSCAGRSPAVLFPSCEDRRKVGGRL